MTEQNTGDSRFYMWRAVFALAHADSVVTDEERRFMLEILDRQPLASSQRRILEEDIKTPQSVADMFAKITEQEDRTQFFYFARMLLWCDGDFSRQEQRIMTHLERYYVQTVDFREVIGHTGLQLEEEEREQIREDAKQIKSRRDIWGSFLRRFGS